ncbi:3-phosphoshikimate 1-carboxyvinyltransferase [Sporosarcina sp. NCCP-2716]|uniref:3-phosphoshikimate 1-carboxyvinyltransferase n=1 Tax=Sporosarcina sp. NCCP-2716 TaxID=2943679 RepID=UPI0020400210|nr:3-phosphoshikimate 1-carboxyvinyltransferase [Sporosarcina sp. NCCP-2716]GKV67955.1 3-phosphoshikimate 1-carboxyvinyltransferase [Sporosarcina sp. NCCP-2716]
MRKIEIHTVSAGGGPLLGELSVPGDKSISHRAVMLGAMAEGTTSITGFLAGEDCLSTIGIFRKLGVAIERQGTDVTVISPGISGWTTPTERLDAGNSGTTARLLLGILSGSAVTAEVTGDRYLCRRPMRRVTDPLAEMGAGFEFSGTGGTLPLTVTGHPLKAITYEMPVASAQVKSAVLFAGVSAAGTTTVREQAVSRDHTERMLTQFGGAVTIDGNSVSVEGGRPLKAAEVKVPGDISSAAFFMCAAAMVPGSSVTFRNVGLNPTRTGILDVLKEMGAAVTETVRSMGAEEPYGDVNVNAGTLQAVEIGGDLIPRLIDELPVIALLATQAEGTTVIRDAGELRVKETDRIEAVCTELRKLGAIIEPTQDGMRITGPVKLKGAVLSSNGDHRLGMMAAVASVVSEGPVGIEGAGCISVSYPGFFEHLDSLT